MNSQPESSASPGRIRTWVLARILDTWPPDYYGEDLDGLIRDCTFGISFDGAAADADAQAQVHRVVDYRQALEKSAIRRQIKSPEFLGKLRRVAYAAAAKWPRLVQKHGRTVLAEDVAQDALGVILRKTRDQETINKLDNFAYTCVRQRLSTMNRDLRDVSVDVNAALERGDGPPDPTASAEQRLADASVSATLLDIAKAEIDSVKEICAEYPKRKTRYLPTDRQRTFMKEAFRRAVCNSWTGNMVWESFSKEEASGVVTRTQFFEMFRVIADRILEPWKRTWRAK